MLRRNKRFDYEYEEEEEDLAAGENALGRISLAPPSKVDWLDYVFAILLGSLTVFFAWALSYKGLHPNAWADYAVASGIRPPDTITGGIWRLVAGGIFKTMGIGAGIAALTFLGKVTLGIMVALGYLTFREIISVLVRMATTNWLWTRVLSRGVCALSVVLFLCADTVWSLGYAFTPVTLTALVFCLSVCLLARFLTGGTTVTIYVAMFVIGSLCAETPLGLFWLAGFWMMFYVLLTKGGLFHVKLLQPLIQQSSKWYITFFWALGLLITVAINISSFKSGGGMELLGMSAGDVPLKYINALWRPVTGAANFGGWIVGIAFALLPFVLSVAMLRRATDVEYFLNYHIGIIFFVTGCLAYTQVASLQPLWFWCFGKAIEVYSPLLLFLCSMMAAVTILCALTVSLVDAFARDHARLAAQYDPDLEDSKRGLTKGQVFFRLGVFILIALFLVGGAIPGRFQRRAKETLAVINDYVGEVVTEAGDAKILFTDGAFDPAIELESARRGGSLKCIMAQNQIWKRLGAEIRTKPLARTGAALSSLMADKEDRLSATSGGDAILLSWIQLWKKEEGGNREKLSQVAVQNSEVLKFWTGIVGDTYPPVSGVVAPRVKADGSLADPKALEDGIERSDALVERVLRICKTGGPAKIAGEKVNDRFNAILSELAGFARIRGQMSGFANKLARSEKEYTSAELFDRYNPIAQGIIEAIQTGKMAAGLMRPMTPREGLQFALLRADFQLAHRYAEYILDADPDDPNANFAVGMDFISRGELLVAEKYLKRCLVKKPYEPAVWNNIAVVQHRLGRYDEALESVKKALELAPTSLEVKDTLKQIESAIADAAEGKAVKETSIVVKRPTGTTAIPPEGVKPAPEK